jgi:hypothetical protein
MLYGPVYSPEYNAIEGLWMDAKRRFSKMMLTEERTDNQNVIRGLVQRAILETSEVFLQRRVKQSLRLMKEWLTE